MEQAVSTLEVKVGLTGSLPDNLAQRIGEMFCADDAPKVVALLESLNIQPRAEVVSEQPKEPEVQEPVKPKRKRRQKEGQETWVPLRKLFKTSNVPEAVADIIQRAIEKMKKAGDIGEDNLFQLLEYLCANYLAGG
jgi:hypothetical protein